MPRARFRRRPNTRFTLSAQSVGASGFRERYKGPVAEENDGPQESRRPQDRYKHLALPARNTVDQVLKGIRSLTQLPKIDSRAVKIFISSTFTDMVEERNKLMATVVPELRTYCKERYGLEFQLVDMRWGVPLHAQDDHSVAQLCLEEIRNCQEQSVGPNFAMFAGQKYGCRMLPSEMPMDEYEPIRRHLREHGEDMEFLDKWYIKDSNCTPAVYVLQRISSVLGKDTGQWRECETRLFQMLLTGADGCVTNGDLELDVLERLKCSVTELECNAGLLDVPCKDNVARNCMVFTRDIQDTQQYMDREKMEKFIDLIEGSTEINEESHNALSVFKNKMIKKLEPKLVPTFTISWIDPHGVDRTGHAEYLESFSKSFFSKVRSLVSENEVKRNIIQGGAQYEEVLRHWDMAKNRTKLFMGRRDILHDIREYIINVTDKPLILYGDSGLGKTSIMAMAATTARIWLKMAGKNIQTSTLIRFCGTSPSSSNIRRLLESLCHQVAYVTDDVNYKVPECHKEIKKCFVDMITKGEFGGMVIIFLDAIDQINGCEEALRLDWVPAKIANNVKFIVSTNSEEGNILPRIKSKITTDSNYIEIGQWDAKECLDTLLFQLNEQHKIVTPPQWELVKKVFQQCSAPLFMTMTLEIVRHWRSYDDAETLSLPDSIENCISHLFDQLELRHGEVLMSYVAAYITAAKGVSAMELEDLLSLNDEVLNSVFLFWEPPVRRIPPNLVSCILHDLSSDLTSRATDEADVIYWFHRQFEVAARRRYLADPCKEATVHRHLAEYFMGIWGGMKDKPFEYNDFLRQRMQIKNKYSSAVRHVPEQPLIFSTFNTAERFNLRKLNQLPYHLAKSRSFTDLDNEVLFNYEWIYTKLRATSVQNVISDYRLVKSRDAQLVSDAILMAEAALATSPEVLGPEITGRLLPHVSQYDNIRNLVRQCDLASQKDCPFVPNWQVYTSPGGPLQYVCEAGNDSSVDVDIIQCQDTVLLTAKPFYSTCMRIWDVTQGEPKPEMELPRDSYVYPSINGKFIHMIRNNRFLQTVRLDSGELYGEVEFGHGNIAQVEVANRYVGISFKDSPGPVLVDTEASLVLHRMAHLTDAIALSKDDRYLLCNYGHCIMLHSLPLMERCCVIQCKSLPVKLNFTTGNSRFYVFFRDKEVQAIDINYVNRQSKTTGIVRDLELRDFKVSHTGNMLLCRASRCLYVFDNAKLKLTYRINNMPAGVFTEKLSTFIEAGFSPNDQLLVAARYTYLGVWDATSGEPLRLLYSSISPVVNLFTPDTLNKAITLLADNSIQVWNLDNLDADIQHCNAVVKGAVVSLAIASEGKRVICTGSHSAEAKVFNTEQGEIEWCLIHSDDMDVILKEVLISPRGRVAVTRCKNKEARGDDHWDILHEDKLWNMATGKTIAAITGDHYVAFDPTDRKVACFQCHKFSQKDVHVTEYSVSIYDVRSNAFKKVPLPPGNIVSKPVITSACGFLTFILQKNVCNQVGRKIDVKHEVHMYVYSFNGLWREWKALTPGDIWSVVTGRETFLDVRPFDDENVIVTYTPTKSAYSLRVDGTIDRSTPMAKAAFIYNIQKDSLLRRVNHVMSPSSDLDTVVVSQNSSVVLDASYDIYDVLSEKHVCKVDYLEHKARPGTIRFILNGQYLAFLSRCGREIHIHRIGQKERLARCFVHGTGNLLEVGGDDRTLFVGCRDGRVMILTVTLASPDPMREIISNLPSRSVKQTQARSKLSTDVKHVEDNKHDLQRLSSLTQEEFAQNRTKQSGFKTVGSTVLFTQELRAKTKSTSGVCSIQ